MSEEEKEAINNLRFYSTNVGFSKYDGTTCVLRAKDVQIVLNLIGKQYAELNSLKEIEQLHQEENGKLRVEFEKVYEDNLTLANELEQEKNKDLQKQLNGAFDRGFISKDKIKEKMEELDNLPCATPEERDERLYAMEVLKEIGDDN